VFQDPRTGPLVEMGVGGYGRGLWFSFLAFFLYSLFVKGDSFAHGAPLKPKDFLCKVKGNGPEAPLSVSFVTLSTYPLGMIDHKRDKFIHSFR
jgi:hypothetical protein